MFTSVHDKYYLVSTTVLTEADTKRMCFQIFHYSNLSAFYEQYAHFHIYAIRLIIAFAQNDWHMFVTEAV